MWYKSKQIEDVVHARRNRGIYLLVTVIFLLTLASFTEAQTVDDDTINVGPAAPPPNDNFNFPQVLSNLGGIITGNNIDATKEPGEPNHAGNVGGHSVWYSWTHPPTLSLGISFSSRNAGTNFDTLIAVYTGTQLNSLTPIAANDDYGSTPGIGRTSTVFFPTVPGTTYWIAVDGFSGLTGSFDLSWDVNRINKQSSRFTGTGNSATTIFRPSTGTWWTTSSTGVQVLKFGTNGDVPTPADFDGDAITDYSVFRNGVWHVLNSRTNTYSVTSFGLAGDKPMPGDYTANGYDDYAVFRPSNGVWYVLDGHTGGFIAQQFGLNLDKPAARDYDGDGRLDFTVFRPSTGVWYTFNTYNQTVSIVNWGVSEDIPVPGEFFVDGKADIAVWRPSNGTWYVRASYGSVKILQFGLAGDIPQVLDYDSSSVFSSDFAVYRPSTGTWYILDNSTNQFWAFQFGLQGDIPASTLYPIQQ